MSFIAFHGSQESLDHIADRLKHHRVRRDTMLKDKPSALQALIVDDDVESIQPLQIVLQNLGFNTVLAFDGKEAFDLMSKSNFDLVFLDISMPEMTGLEVLQKVDAFQAHHGKFFHRDHPLPVITYSSYAMGEYELPDGKNFFFADHWQKPVALSDLVSLANQALADLGLKGGQNGKTKN